MRIRLSFFAAMLLSLPLAAQQTGTGYLTVKAHPGRAGVFVDGKYLGPAANFRVARTYTVAPGEHELKLSEPRYEDVVKKVNVTPGKKTVVREAMKALPAPKPPFGMLRIKEPDKFAAVYLNDKFMGHAGEFNNSVQGLKIPAGEYALRVEPSAGGKGIQETVKIMADQTTVVRAGK